jgi:hypothetical protein
MKKGSVIVDVAIDQGGCFETSHATTHAEPTYEVDGVIHYCVANMPGAVPITSAHALNNATLQYGLMLADKGLKAIAEDRHLRAGLNVHQGPDHQPAGCRCAGLRAGGARPGAQGRLSTCTAHSHVGLSTAPARPHQVLRAGFFVQGLSSVRHARDCFAVIAVVAR